VIVFCCHEQMDSIWKEAFGEVFRCKVCGTEVSVNYDRNTVSVNGRGEGGEHNIRETKDV